MKPVARAMPALLALTMIAGTAVAATTTAIRVTRFHLNQPIPPGTVAVDMAPDSALPPGPEADSYTAAIATAAQGAGFTAAVAGTPADYRLVARVSRSVADLPPAPPPLSIGLGGGGGSGSVGLGGSVAFGVGKRQPRAAVTTELSLRLTRGTAPDVIWEGRAIQTIEERGKLVQPAAEADKLARALFKGFPGQSGRTISVK